MNIADIRIRQAGDEPGLIPALADVLIDCVAGGASVSFMWPLPREKALAFWRGVTASAGRGERLLLIAEDSSGQLHGTVQVILDLPDNQPHRGDVAKTLVHRRARGIGLGAALMQARSVRRIPRGARCWYSTPSPAAMPSAFIRASGGSGSA
jgi:GNAT superfamily N-acetyltransferase